jgi:hypothetical protein
MTLRSNAGFGMGYAAITVAILGGVVGAVFRLKVLLAFVGLLFMAAVMFSIFRGFGFLETALTIFAVQSILQGGYFIGLVAKSLFPGAHRVRRII